MSTSSEFDHYVCPIQLDQAIMYLLWYSGDQDGVVVESGNVLYWNSERELLLFIEFHGILLKEEFTPFYDLDLMERFIDQDGEVDARTILDTWNLLVDVAASVNEVEFLEASNSLDEVYGLLFSLSGVASWMGYKPKELSTNEYDSIRCLLRFGMSMLRRRLQCFACDS